MAATSRLPLFCVIFAIVIGSWGRLAHLGDRELWTDELNHHFVAKSIAAGEGPKLPSGERYLRGLAISRAIAVTQSRIRDPELAVRLPSAAFGVLNLVLIAIIAWALAGPWAAVWATVLLAIYPEAVGQARTGRFYSYQLNFGLVALAAGWYATRDRVVGATNEARQQTAQWAWMILAALALFLGYRIQPTTLPAAVGFAMWVAGVGLVDLRRGGRAAFRRSVPVQATTLMLMGAAAMLVSGHLGQLFEQWWSRARSTATWVGADSTSRKFYLGKLSERIPWVMSLFPLLALIAWRRAPRLTSYLLTWFVVPLVVHSLILVWKGERYFLLPLPALFIVAGMGASHALGLFATAARRVMAERGLPMASVISSSLVAAASLWAIVTLPGFALMRHFRSEAPDSTPWRVSGEILQQSPELAGVPWGSMDPLVSLHFWGRADFGIQPGLLDYAVAPATRHPALRFPPATDTLRRDYYAGVPLVTSPAAIRQAYQRYGAVIVGLYPDWSTFVERELAETLAREGQELCQLRCPGGFRLYLWRLVPAARAEGASH